MHFHHTERSDQPRPQQLPGDIRGFVNRQQELQQLDAVLTDDGGEPLVVSVCVIAGTAGVGKTSLALRWAHRVHDHFSDGQLYANLRGYDPGPPVTAQETLHGFLRALGVPPQSIPVEPEARAALYRSLLAGRRMLVVLDNAASVGQVRPLLPGSAGSLVLVTSRSRLSGLVVRDGARRVTLGTLAEPEAVALLRAVTVGYRPEDDHDKLVELAQLCARLPLALRIAAERAASRPHLRLDDLIADLRDESALWEALSIEDDEEADAVRTVFAWSYRALPDEAARLFRLLGLHPGPGFGVPAAAALAGIGVGRARQLLDVLVGAHVLEQTGADRYEFHDLLRAYAADQAQREEPSASRDAALRRVLAWYLHSADAAQTRINPNEPHIPLDSVEDGVTPLAFSDYDEAMRWYEAERANLLAAVRAAEQAGLDRTAWQLPAVLRSVHMLVNHFEEWETMGLIGLRAARRLGDRAGETELLESLGMACTQSQRLSEATGYHHGALEGRRALGDRLGEAFSLNALALIHLRERRLRAAEESFREALAVFRELDEPHWAAVVLANLGKVKCEVGEWAEAEEHIGCALEEHRRLGDQGSEGNALRLLSVARRGLGRPGEALLFAQAAVEIARKHRNAAQEGYWLLEVGRAQQADGRADEALVSFQRSAVLQRQLGDRSREAEAWNAAGEAYRDSGRPEEAVAFHRRAAAVHRELGDRWQLAVSLDLLAGALAREERPGEARTHWSEASRALEGFDDPVAERMRERIGQALAAEPEDG